MTNKTPIEKAADEVADELFIPDDSEHRQLIAATIRRVLSEEVPEKKRTYGHGMQSTLDSWEARAYNQARRDFLGKED